MAKLRKKIIEEPIYKTTVIFLAGCDYKKMCEVVRKTGNYIDDEDYFKYSDGANLNFNKSDNPIRLVWVESLKKDPCNLGVVVHEIFHLVVRILDTKGIIIEEYNNHDEAGAYLIDYYFREFYKFLTEPNGKKK